MATPSTKILGLTPRMWVVTGVLAFIALARTKRLSTSAGAGLARKLKHGDPAPYMDRIRKAVARHPELSGKLSILLGLLDQESRFDPDATSPTGAAGIGQFTNSGIAEVKRLVAQPRYARRYDNEPRVRDILSMLTKTSVRNASTGIEAAALLLAGNIEIWGGVEAALTAYNAGGVAAGLVRDAGSHAAALSALEALPDNRRSQSPEYAPGVLARAADFAAMGVAGLRGLGSAGASGAHGTLNNCLMGPQAPAWSGMTAIGNYVVAS